MSNTDIKIEGQQSQVCLHRRYEGIMRKAEYKLCGLICMRLRIILKEANDDKITHVTWMSDKHREKKLVNIMFMILYESSQERQKIKKVF